MFVIFLKQRVYDEHQNTPPYLISQCTRNIFSQSNCYKSLYPHVNMYSGFFFLLSSSNFVYLAIYLWYISCKKYIHILIYNDIYIIIINNYSYIILILYLLILFIMVPRLPFYGYTTVYITGTLSMTFKLWDFPLIIHIVRKFLKLYISIYQEPVLR